MAYNDPISNYRYSASAEALHCCVLVTGSVKWCKAAPCLERRSGTGATLRPLSLTLMPGEGCRAKERHELGGMSWYWEFDVNILLCCEEHVHLSKSNRDAWPGVIVAVLVKI